MQISSLIYSAERNLQFYPEWKSYPCSRGLQGFQELGSLLSLFVSQVMWTYMMSAHS